MRAVYAAGSLPTDRYHQHMNPAAPGPGPVVGITTDVEDASGRLRARASVAYADAIARAGGVPVLLAPDVDQVGAHLALCDALVLTGGDDPRTEPFGEPTHPRATPVHARRQAYETALLTRLSTDAPERPVLGVCLGMQMMALVAGGRLEQHMPDSIATSAEHVGDRVHRVVPTHGAALAQGEVASHHRQCVTDAGSMRVIGIAHDGVVEAIDDPARPFYLGVQWHPERTAETALGQDLFDALVEACGPAGAARGLRGASAEH